MEELYSVLDRVNDITEGVLLKAVFRS